MLKYYKTVENTIVELDTMEPGCWVSAVAPTETEISSLQEELNIDRDLSVLHSMRKKPPVLKAMTVRHL